MDVLNKKKMIKVTVTGPESTGKTAIARALAGVLGIRWVPEFARYYVEHLGRPYVQRDLRAIGLGQKLWETWHLLRIEPEPGPPVLLCDTDWTVLQIWEQYRFHMTEECEWQKGYGAADNADLYFLCAPDFAWQPDPLREHPEERHSLFQLYENLLRQRQANFVTLTGTHDSRLQTAAAAIHKFF